MTISVRKTFKVGPFRVSVSRRGVSVSIRKNWK